MTDALTARIGLDQGRVQRPDLSVVLALGSTQEGHLAFLDDGDEITATQIVDFDANPTDIIRLAGLFTTPEDIEGSGLAWELSLEVVGKAHIPTMRGIPGLALAIDLVKPTIAYTGILTLILRLALVTA